MASMRELINVEIVCPVPYQAVKGGEVKFMRVILVECDSENITANLFYLALPPALIAKKMLY